MGAYKLKSVELFIGHTNLKTGVEEAEFVELCSPNYGRNKVPSALVEELVIELKITEKIISDVTKDIKRNYDELREALLKD